MPLLPSPSMIPCRGWPPRRGTDYGGRRRGWAAVLPVLMLAAYSCGAGTTVDTTTTEAVVITTTTRPPVTTTIEVSTTTVPPASAVTTTTAVEAAAAATTTTTVPTTTTTAPTTTTTTRPPADSCDTIGRRVLAKWAEDDPELWGEYRLGDLWPWGDEDIQPGERVCAVTFEPPPDRTTSRSYQVVVCADWAHYQWGGELSPAAVEICLASIRGARNAPGGNGGG